MEIVYNILQNDLDFVEEYLKHVKTSLLEES
jgi:hypothetical protein